MESEKARFRTRVCGNLWILSLLGGHKVLKVLKELRNKVCEAKY